MREEEKRQGGLQLHRDNHMGEKGWYGYGSSNSN
jgi:hypothetical protein